MSARVAAAAICLATAGCAGGNAASHLASPPQYAPRDQTKVGVAKSPMHPLIVEWPGTERGRLAASAERGLVVVRLIGDEMQILDDCSVKTDWKYTPFARTTERKRIRDADELSATIPLGAAHLKGRLARGGELDVDITLVGRWDATTRNANKGDLHGACQGATHVVLAFSVGAFRFSSKAAAHVGGGAGALGAVAEGSSLSQEETISQAGDENACASPPRWGWSGPSGPPEGCGAPVGLELAAIGDPPTCSKGTEWNGSQCVPPRGGNDGLGALLLMMLLGGA